MFTNILQYFMETIIHRQHTIEQKIPTEKFIMTIDTSELLEVVENGSKPL